jgi:hypothetical protein
MLLRWIPDSLESQHWWMNALFQATANEDISREMLFMYKERLRRRRDQMGIAIIPGTKGERRMRERLEMRAERRRAKKNPEENEEQNGGEIPEENQEQVTEERDISDSELYCLPEETNNKKQNAKKTKKGKMTPEENPQVNPEQVPEQVLEEMDISNAALHSKPVVAVATPEEPKNNNKEAKTNQNQRRSPEQATEQVLEETDIVDAALELRIDSGFAEYAEDPEKKKTKKQGKKKTKKKNGKKNGKKKARKNKPKKKKNSAEILEQPPKSGVSFAPTREEIEDPLGSLDDFTPLNASLPPGRPLLKKSVTILSTPRQLLRQANPAPKPVSINKSHTGILGMTLEMCNTTVGNSRAMPARVADRQLLTMDMHEALWLEQELQCPAGFSRKNRNPDKLEQGDVSRAFYYMFNLHAALPAPWNMRLENRRMAEVLDNGHLLGCREMGIVKKSTAVKLQKEAPKAEMAEQNPTDKDTFLAEMMTWTARFQKAARDARNAGVDNEEDVMRTAWLRTDPDAVVQRDSLVKDPKARRVKKGPKKARRCVFSRRTFRNLGTARPASTAKKTLTSRGQFRRTFNAFQASKRFRAPRACNSSPIGPGSLRRARPLQDRNTSAPIPGSLRRAPPLQDRNTSAPRPARYTPPAPGSIRRARAISDLTASKKPAQKVAVQSETSNFPTAQFSELTRKVLKKPIPQSEPQWQKERPLALPEKFTSKKPVKFHRPRVQSGLRNWLSMEDIEVAEARKPRPVSNGFQRAMQVLNSLRSPTLQDPQAPQAPKKEKKYSISAALRGPTPQNAQVTQTPTKEMKYSIPQMPTPPPPCVLRDPNTPRRKTRDIRGPFNPEYDADPTARDAAGLFNAFGVPHAPTPPRRASLAPLTNDFGAPLTTNAYDTPLAPDSPRRAHLLSNPNVRHHRVQEMMNDLSIGAPRQRSVPYAHAPDAPSAPSSGSPRSIGQFTNTPIPSVRQPSSALRDPNSPRLPHGSKARVQVLALGEVLTGVACDNKTKTEKKKVVGQQVVQKDDNDKNNQTYQVDDEVEAPQTRVAGLFEAQQVPVIIEHGGDHIFEEGLEQESQLPAHVHNGLAQDDQHGERVVEKLAEDGVNAAAQDYGADYGQCYCRKEGAHVDMDEVRNMVLRNVNNQQDDRCKL